MKKFFSFFLLISLLIFLFFDENEKPAVKTDFPVEIDLNTIKSSNILIKTKISLPRIAREINEIRLPPLNGGGHQICSRNEILGIPITIACDYEFSAHKSGNVRLSGNGKILELRVPIRASGWGRADNTQRIHGAINTELVGRINIDVNNDFSITAHVASLRTDRAILMIGRLIPFDMTERINRALENSRGALNNQINSSLNRLNVRSDVSMLWRDIQTPKKIQDSVFVNRHSASIFTVA